MKRLFSFVLILISILTLSSCLKKETNPADGVPSPLTSIELLRSAHKGTDVSVAPEMLAGAVNIRGVVISDHSGNNLPGGYIILQNTSRGRTRGIILNTNAELAKSYIPGDSLEVKVDGLMLVRANGVLRLENVSADRITKLADSVPVTIAQVSVSALVANFKEYESTLVEVTADVIPVPQPGEKYKGVKALSDGTESNLMLYTDEQAAFANNGVPASATFAGIATYHNASGNQSEGAETRLCLRTIQDVTYASGPMYSGFPEDFESPDYTAKGSYNMTAIDNNIDLKTGNWKLYYAILGNTAGRDRFNPTGKQCIRMQQQLDFDAYLQMNFDLPNGASKVTFSYGSYYNDASSTFQLEYSTDEGTTWQQTGEAISDADAAPKVATFMLNIQGPVRFRINKLGLGATNGVDVFNGRLSIEDFAVFSN